MMAVLFAAAALMAAQITSASAKRDNAELTVHIDADGPIDAGKVSARLEQRRLVLLLPATLDSASRTFHVAHRYLQARREGSGIELEVPLGSKVACGGPVTVAQVAGGLEARVRCTEELPSKTAAAVEQPAASPQAIALQSAPQASASQPAHVESHAAEVRALAAKPLEVRVEAAKPLDVRVEAPQPAEPRVAAVKAEAPAAKPGGPAEVRGESREPAATTPEPPASIFETKALQPQVDLLGEKQKSSPLGAAAGALAVVALGAAAYFLRNQKARKASLIEVLETAPLGPRRSLVLARVGGKTLLLASSEAGISMLENVGDLAAREDGDGFAGNAGRFDEPAPQPALLARLRKFAQPKLASAAPDPFAKLSKYLKPAAAPQFDALFAEEQEDQELRMKLLAGQSARVQ
jgi:flagellar biogenesis protein FliO